MQAMVHTYMKEKRRIWIKDPFYVCEICDIYGKRSCHICEHAYIYAILLFHICQTRVTYMSRFSWDEGSFALNEFKKSDKVAMQLKARGDLIGLGFDWFSFIPDWFRFRIG